MIEKGIAIINSYRYAHQIMSRHKMQEVHASSAYWWNSNDQEVIWPDCKPVWDAEVKVMAKLYFAEHEPIERRVKRGYGGRHCVNPDSIHPKYHVNGENPTLGGPYATLDLFTDNELMCISLIKKVDSIVAEWDEDMRVAVYRKYLVEGAPIADTMVHKNMKADGYKLTMKQYKNTIAGCLVNLASHFKEFDFRGSKGGATVAESNQAVFV